MWSGIYIAIPHSAFEKFILLQSRGRGIVHCVLSYASDSGAAIGYVNGGPKRGSEATEPGRGVGKR